MTRFVAIRITHCLSARNFANHLPCPWQTFAMPMAKFCQRGGKALPMERQNLANKEARKKTEGVSKLVFTTDYTDLHR